MRLHKWSDTLAKSKLLSSDARRVLLWLRSRPRSPGTHCGRPGRHRSQRRRAREMHILRHSFCSRLAMRGATAKSIQ